MEGGSHWKNLEPAMSSSTIECVLDHQLLSDFYATISECCLDFQQLDENNIAAGGSGRSSLVPGPNDHKVSSEIQTTGDNVFSGILHPYYSGSTSSQHHHHPHNSCGDLSAISLRKNASLSNEEIKSFSGDASLLGTEKQLEHPSVLEKDLQESSTGHLGAAALGSSNSASSGPILSGKKRITWTKDLHDKFIKCVNSLGGAEKATPKAILKKMQSKGLTMLHVKSHLQKYRSEKCMSEYKLEKHARRIPISDVPRLCMKSMEITKASLKLQQDMVRSLQEQLEIQQNLQLEIEENGRRLKMMMDQQHKICKQQQPTDIKLKTA